MWGVVAYLSKRVLLGVVTLLGVLAVLVSLTAVLPGDPARVIAGLEASEQEVERIRESMGLNKSLPAQYLSFLTRLLHGDLGTAATTGQPVTEEISSRLPYTISLALVGTALGVLLGVSLGVLAAKYRGRWIDSLTSAISVTGVSMPVFWLGILLIMLFAVKLQILPAAGAGGVKSIVLPGITVAVFMMAVIARMTRSAMIEEEGKDYIRILRSRGISEWRITVVHALRNAFIPVLTVIGLQFGAVLGGAVLTENVFSWPGLGRLLVNAISSRDYPLVQGIVFIFAAIFILVNVVIDVLYTVVDPRVKLHG